MNHAVRVRAAWRPGAGAIGGPARRRWAPVSSISQNRPGITRGEPAVPKRWWFGGLVSSVFGRDHRRGESTREGEAAVDFGFGSPGLFATADRPHFGHPPRYGRPLFASG